MLSDLGRNTRIPLTNGHLVCYTQLTMKKPKPLTLAANLKRARLVKLLTQDELAKRAGCSKPMISMLEQGVRMPSLQMLGALARVLGVEPSDLLRPTGRVSR